MLQLISTTGGAWKATYYNWGAAGINIYGDAYDTESNVMTDWNAATGFHWDTNFKTINASSIYARHNLYHGMQLERNTGPMNLTQFVSCNNSNAALSAGGAPTTAGGISLRDSGGVTLTNSLMYGNGSSQLKILGSAGGIKVPDWLTGKYVTVQNQNFTNTGNIMESTDFSQDVFRDPQLNGTDWLTFQSTLISGNNTWWNDANTDSYVLPVPNLYFATDFSGWQLTTLQDSIRRIASLPGIRSRPAMWIRTCPILAHLQQPLGDRGCYRPDRGH